MPKVLIVEDDRDYADALMRALRETDPAFPSARFDVNSTSDPDVAIQYAERDAIDIFIVDLKLSQTHVCSCGAEQSRIDRTRSRRLH
jgi:DNA-binding response OmpR family regulator